MRSPFVRASRVVVAAVLLGGVGPTASAQADPKAKNAPVPRVTAAHLPDLDPAAPVQLSDELVVDVANLDVLLTKAATATPARRVVLFLDGRPLKDLSPYPPTDPDKSQLRYQLKRTEASRDVWTHLLGKPAWGTKVVPVSVGFEDGYPIESGASIHLRPIPTGPFWTWLLVLAGLIAAFWALAKQSDILRDPGPPPPDGQRRPYSLSRMQAAWWFFLVLVSYLGIGAITGDFSTSITGTVLVLTGISAGTMVGSAVIDSGTPPAPGPAQPPQNAGGLNAPAPAVPASQAWWYDILCDPPYGVSFHRFQNAAWTFVLGIVFVSQVYTGLAMPTFDGTLLALMGISAGTYLGLKTAEK